MREPVYESIGQGYARSRRPDPGWAALIAESIGAARSVINVGAGSGSYEPEGVRVVAVEPSRTMIRQRPPGAAPVVRARAEGLPFADDAFDVGLAVLTTHHWDDPHLGLSELRRVARRQVVVTWDPRLFAERFWLVRDYLPEIGRRELGLATRRVVEQALATTEVVPLPVAADCVDGTLGAFWRRPTAYLDPATRGAMSGIALEDPVVVADAMQQLASDLQDGTWQRRNAELARLDSLDLGYCIVCAGA